MVTWKDKKFYINDEPIEIHAGSIHYFRSMPDKWYELLLKLKNCGLNAVETYCAWNLHEPYQGEYDFAPYCTTLCRADRWPVCYAARR